MDNRIIPTERSEWQSAGVSWLDLTDPSGVWRKMNPTVQFGSAQRCKVF